MKQRNLVCLISLLSVYLSASAATVFLSSSDAAMSAARVEDNFKLLGFVGDFVELAPGEHHLRIAAARDYALLVDLHVTATAVSVGEFRPEPGNCKAHYAVNWQRPTVQSTAAKATARSKEVKNAQADSEVASAVKPGREGHWILRIAAPAFGERLSGRSCALPSMLGCNQNMMVVDFNSTPPGAEIWVNDERVGTTNVTLSVPYCPSRDKTKEVLLRRSGHRNCSMQLAVVEDGKRVPLMCDLAEVP